MERYANRQSVGLLNNHKPAEFVSEMGFDCLTVREELPFYIRELVVPCAGLAYYWSNLGLGLRIPVVKWDTEMSKTTSVIDHLSDVQ